MNKNTHDKLSDKLNHLVQQAVDEAIEKHRERGEAIAISDDNGKVIIIPAEEIPNIQNSNPPFCQETSQE